MLLILYITNKNLSQYLIQCKTLSRVCVELGASLQTLESKIKLDSAKMQCQQIKKKRWVVTAVIKTFSLYISRGLSHILRPF